MSSSSTNRLSISNDSGMSLNLFLQSSNRFNCLNEFVDILNIYFYIKTSISAKILNNNALPSITGFEASGPISPSPKTAVPFVITATKLPLAVYLIHY
jgi:hypothetical protein